MQDERFSGVISAVCAYLMWGFLPIYWKLLRQASALEILTHRFIWSLFFLLVFLLLTRRQSSFRNEVRAIGNEPRRILGVLIATVLITFNWLVYIWAVNDNRIIETSLGYYINPLVNVLFGVALLKEKLSKRQYLAVILAAAGVLNLILHFGQFPWVALSLAVSFSLYGLCKKLLGIAAITGITLETMLISPLALTYLLYLNSQGTGVFGVSYLFTSALLVGAGVVTALPMVLFANAANRLPLSLLGFIQYLSPTIALLTGVFLYHEPFTQAHAISFGLIWLALAIFSWR
ncbi:MAG: EamA family transporter RarD [Negativicutes bacterium]